LNGPLLFVFLCRVLGVASDHRVSLMHRTSLPTTNGFANCKA
jgi:hypothetical protein